MNRITTHPGDVLKEELEARGISQKKFSEVLSIPYTHLNDALMEIAKRRGGEAEAGSCLWADLDEHRKSKPFNGICQVFGHTQQKKKAIIKRSFADLDCRKAFLITPPGKITEELFTNYH